MTHVPPKTQLTPRSATARPERQGEGGAGEGRADVGGHVIRALVVVAIGAQFAPGVEAELVEALAQHRRIGRAVLHSITPWRARRRQVGFRRITAENRIW